MTIRTAISIDSIGVKVEKAPFVTQHPATLIKPTGNLSIFIIVKQKLLDFICPLSCQTAAALQRDPKTTTT